jgi:quinol monooxygenase YgiN
MVTGMERIARHVKFTAQPGKGDELAELLRPAGEMSGAELYLVGRAPDDADVVWVMEVWSSKDAAEEALDDPEV